jgi:hypothetical protein
MNGAFTILAALALVGAIGGGIAVVHHEGVVTGDAAGYKRGHAEAVEKQREWDADRLRMAQAASAAEALHEQEHRTLIAQQEKVEHDAQVATRERDAARADAAAAHRSLLDAAEALAAADSRGGRPDEDPAAVARGGLPGVGAVGVPAASVRQRADGLLVEVLGWADQTAGDLADYADDLAARLGACRAEYDAVRTTTNGG